MTLILHYFIAPISCNSCYSMLILTKSRQTQDALRQLEAGTLFSMDGLPIRGGDSINWGTVGCCLWKDGHPYGLTNYHVLFGEHTPSFVSRFLAGRLEVKLAGTQAGLKMGIATTIFHKTLDYAVFEITEPFPCETLTELGKPLIPQTGMEVCKNGGATGLTYGIIDNIEGSTVFIRKNTGKTTEKLCEYGDSGSLWIYNDGHSRPHPVALHQGLDTHNVQRGRACAFNVIEASIDTIQHMNPK